ncbi:MAG TPA: hypothetical protein VNT54_07780 [Solirubrobacteraceae bacterium]|nr:hypothetical protein [Solirubrobacteraceae bacterium]
MRSRRLTAAVVAVLLSIGCASTAAAQGAGDAIASLQRSTPLDEYAGWLLFSRWDGSAYRLSTWRAGAVRDLPVAPQPAVFDADAGPDLAGKPSAVVSLCRGSCDLYAIGFEPGDTLRPVRNANTANRDEIAPSVWKGRLVFGRRYGPHQVVPYTKLLAAPRSRPSQRLAGLPQRRCGAIDPPDCRRIEDAILRSMELWGRWIAQSWTYQPDDFPGFRQNEIRLTNVARSDTRQVAAMNTGLGGQTYLGPSIAEGRVAFFRACQGDPAGCSTSDSGAIRYRISNGDYTHVGASEAWTGWTWSGAADYHVPSAVACGGGDPAVVTPPCAVVRRSGLRWTPIDARRVR